MPWHAHASHWPPIGSASLQPAGRPAPAGAERLSEDEWRRGWKVVLGGSVGIGTGVGLYTMVDGLFVRPLEDGFGWSRGEIAAAGAFAVLSYGAIFGSLLVAVSFALASGAILFGATYDRFGDYDPALAAGMGAYLVAAACVVASGISRSRSELSAT